MTDIPLTGDPTDRTLETVHREISGLQEKLELLISGQGRITEEKLRSIALQFEMLERHRLEQKTDTEKGVAAALQAAKEAVEKQTVASGLATTKSETSMTKSTEQLNATFTAAINAVTNMINDLKERVGKIEGMRQGGEGVRENRRADTAIMIAAISGIVAVVSTIYMIIHG